MDGGEDSLGGHGHPPAYGAGADGEQPTTTTACARMATTPATTTTSVADGLRNQYRYRNLAPSSSAPAVSSDLLSLSDFALPRRSVPLAPDGAALVCPQPDGGGGAWRRSTGRVLWPASVLLSERLAAELDARRPRWRPRVVELGAGATALPCLVAAARGCAALATDGDGAALATLEERTLTLEENAGAIRRGGGRVDAERLDWDDVAARPSFWDEQRAAANEGGDVLVVASDVVYDESGHAALAAALGSAVADRGMEAWLAYQVRCPAREARFFDELARRRLRFVPIEGAGGDGADTGTNAISAQQRAFLRCGRISLVDEKNPSEELVNQSEESVNQSAEREEPHCGMWL